jgi:hypothetical protein
MKRQHIYLSIEDSEVVLVCERNNAGLKKLSHVLSEETSDSSAFLNVICLLKYVLNCEQHCSYLDPDYPTSGHCRLKGCNVYEGIQMKQVYCDNTANLPLKFQSFLLVFFSFKMYLTTPSLAKGSGRDLFQVNIPEFGCRNWIRLPEASV